MVLALMKVVHCVELLEVVVAGETVGEGEGQERKGEVGALAHCTALPLLLGAGLGVPCALGVALGKAPADREAMGLALSALLRESEALVEGLTPWEMEAVRETDTVEVELALGVRVAVGVGMGEMEGVEERVGVELAEEEAAPEALGMGVPEGVAHEEKRTQDVLLVLAPGLGLAVAEMTLEVVEEEGVGVGALPVGVPVGVVVGVPLGAPLALSVELALAQQEGEGSAPGEGLALRVQGEALEKKEGVGQSLAVQQLLPLGVLLALLALPAPG